MMTFAIRMVVSVILAGLLCFCVFGFFASYEASVSFGFQTIYAMTAAMCALAMAGMWLDLRRSLPCAEANQHDEAGFDFRGRMTR
jgi:Na+/melibiose symporter-like transporter